MTGKRPLLLHCRDFDGFLIREKSFCVVLLQHPVVLTHSHPNPDAAAKRMVALTTTAQIRRPLAVLVWKRTK